MIKNFGKWHLLRLLRLGSVSMSPMMYQVSLRGIVIFFFGFGGCARTLIFPQKNVLVPTSRLLGKSIAMAVGSPIPRTLASDPELFGGIEEEVLDADGQRVPKLAAWYWIRTRGFWPDLSELMLYWLCAPVSTAGLERGFSYQTMIDQDTRRLMTTAEHMRDDMMAHLHRDWFNERIFAAL